MDNRTKIKIYRRDMRFTLNGAESALLQGDRETWRDSIINFKYGSDFFRSLYPENLIADLVNRANDIDERGCLYFFTH